MTTTHSTSTHAAPLHDHLPLRDRLHVPRSRGVGTGMLLILLGVWGGLVPFLGPVFGYSFTPDNAWDMTWGRLWLEVLPAAATVLGALSLSGSANRISAATGAWLAAAGGAWFVIGQWVSMLWNHGVPAAGTPTAATTLGRVVEQIGFFSGLGVVIVFLAAHAMGRMSVVAARDVAAVQSERAAMDRTTTDRTTTDRTTTGRTVTTDATEDNDTSVMRPSRRP